MRIVIIGGVAAGAACATRLRRLNEELEIIIVERGPYVSFANCGLPYYLGGEIPQRSSLLVQTPASLRSRFNLEVRIQTEAIELNAAKREVKLRHTLTQEVSTLNYDELVLAPGAAPLMPPIPGIQRPGCFSVRSLLDVDAIKEWIAAHPVKRAVVVGGGFVGLEMVEQLSRSGLEVQLVEGMSQVLAPLDVEMAAILQQELVKNGVQVHLGSAVAGFEAALSAQSEQCLASVVVLQNGQRLPADLVILALGVRPEVALARAAGVTIGRSGGIEVNRYQQTNLEHVWAAGDAVEVKHLVTGAPTLVALAGPASKQGRLVADNIAFVCASQGSAPLSLPSSSSSSSSSSLSSLSSSSSNYPKQLQEYRGTTATAVMRLFGVVAASTGVNERILTNMGQEFCSVRIYAASHAGYYPGAQTIALKLLFCKRSGKIFGAQAVGKEGADKRIDVIATVLRLGGTVYDLAQLDLCYAPPVGSAKDPVNIIGMAAGNVCDGLVDIADWRQVAELEASGKFLLDVRSAGETQRGMIPGAYWIPLDSLRDRLDELKAQLKEGQEIIVHCQSGQRSYYACRLLAQHGFKVANFSGAYLTWNLLFGHNS